MSDISHQIWNMKYRLKSPDGTPIDADIPHSWARVALAAAQAEAPETPRALGHRLRRGPGGPSLPAGGADPGGRRDRPEASRSSTASSWGRSPTPWTASSPHSREAALTLQQGGGIGYDFSTLRPKGAPVEGVGADASGPISFMDVWDAMCRTIMSAGSRRGAMMATLACDHPDIEDFVEAKRKPGRLSMFNLSVLVSDAFMDAVKSDAHWDLVFGGKIYKTLRARELWDRIMRSTYDYAEPGVIFIDRINAAEQSFLLRDDPRHQSLRRTAPAALRRVPSRLDQSRAAGEGSIRRQRAYRSR